MRSSHGSGAARRSGCPRSGTCPSDVASAHGPDSPSLQTPSRQRADTSVEADSSQPSAARASHRALPSSTKRLGGDGDGLLRYDLSDDDDDENERETPPSSLLSCVVNVRRPQQQLFVLLTLFKL